MRRADLETGLCACLALLLPEDTPKDEEEARWLARRFPGRAWIAVELVRGGADRARLRRLEGLGLPLCAAGDVHMHGRERRPLQDTLTAIRLRTPLESAGHALYPNGERHLRDRETLARLYPERLLSETIEIARRCRFSLDELRYEYPEELWCRRARRRRATSGP